MIEFRLPELGEGIESGQVIEVFVTSGDRVTLEQPLLEVETDKAAIEIPSPADGTVIDVCVSAGDTVGINQIPCKNKRRHRRQEAPFEKRRRRPGWGRREKTRRRGEIRFGEKTRRRKRASRARSSPEKRSSLRAP